MVLYINVLIALTLFGSIHSTKLHTLPGCTGSAMYEVTFRNLITNRRFGTDVPSGGLVYSPLAGVSHTNRMSFFTVRGFANSAVARIAKTGQNDKFIHLAKKVRSLTGKVLSVVDAGAPTPSGGKTTITLRVDCARPSITVLSMVAPTPDFIVQINNVLLYSISDGKFVKERRGTLIAYDAGVDDGDQFTDPLDLTLDIPTRPQKNIAPLVEDMTDPFNGRRIGRYFIRRID